MQRATCYNTGMDTIRPFTRARWIQIIAEEYDVGYDQAAYAVDILSGVVSRDISAEILMDIVKPGRVGMEGSTEQRDR